MLSFTAVKQHTSPAEVLTVCINGGSCCLFAGGWGRGVSQGSLGYHSMRRLVSFSLQLSVGPFFDNTSVSAVKASLQCLLLSLVTHTLPDEADVFESHSRTAGSYKGTNQEVQGVWFVNSIKVQYHKRLALLSSEVYSHQIQVKSQVSKIRHARPASERVRYEASRTTEDVIKLVPQDERA